MIIEDGTGSGGFKAKVDERNELHVTSSTKTKEHEISQDDGLAFFANTADTADTLTATATGGAMLYLKNTSATKKLTVEKILTSADTAGGVVKWMKNVVVGSISDNNIHTPVNNNFASGFTAEALCYSWDESNDGLGGLTGGTILKTFITGAGFTVHPLDGSIILGLNDSITVYYKVAGGGEFEAGIRFYYV
jgi:hypothetical protein